MQQMVLHRPFEPAGEIGNIGTGWSLSRIGFGRS